ncbi:hypothetical protein RND81_10G126900 [Saponaria officinalis]|uniref:Transmembrane protein 33 homolog n=1 Tax=Saponaria officinalis TaxID=3572 RepID=A0AAW1I3Y5_SAPOF
MGDEQEEQQKLKRIAAASYNYDNDARWADYWSNILIPPHMASRADVVDHFKRKFYQRFIDPGLIVEPMSLSGSAQPTKQTSSSSMPANDQARPRSSASTSRTPGPNATANSSSGAAPPTMRWDRQTIQFSVNAWVFVLALLSIIPLIPVKHSNRAYRLSFMGTACSSLYSLYSLYGTPRAWNLQAVQMWLQSIVATKDFIYFMYSVMFVTSQLCLKFALIPILCRSLELVAKFLRRNFSRSNLYRKYLEDICVWVESNGTTLSILSSHAEVGLGFLLIVSLLSWQRNFIKTFMYWQLLKLMYKAPVTSGYHQSVWTKIGRTVNPAIQRYAPFLDTPLSVAQRWWFR